MLFIKAVVKAVDGDVVFSQVRGESTAKLALAAFEAELKAAHGDGAVFHLEDVHYV
ncbi:hypothetical protein KUR62_001241 [Escherichia coli]|nr:hypothetical protein [Escherichia coli]